MSILSPVTDNLLFLIQRKREKRSTKDGRKGLSWDCLHTKRTRYQPSYTALCLDSKKVGLGGGDAIDGTHTSQDILLKNDKILSYIYAHLFLCLVIHYKQPDLRQFKIYFYIGLYIS